MGILSSLMPFRKPNERRPKAPAVNLPRDMKKKLTLFGVELSKKYSALLITMAVSWIVAKTGLPAEGLTQFLTDIFNLALAYIVGQSLVDVTKEHAAGKAEIAKQERLMVEGSEPIINYDDIPKAVRLPSTETLRK